MITGVYIWIGAMIVAFINMILIFAFDDDYAVAGIIIHVLCAIAMVIGMGIFAVDFVHWLEAH